MPRHGEVKRAAQLVKPFKPFEPFKPLEPLKPFKLTLRVVLVEHSVNSLDTFLCAEAAEE